MAGAEAELAGMAKHFNAVTNYGRANVAKVRKVTHAQLLAFFTLMNFLIYLG